jgi:hypothetical protein
MSRRVFRMGAHSRKGPATMKVIDPAKVLASENRRLERVPTPEWGKGSIVYVRSLSLDELLEISPELQQKGSRRLAAIVIKAACKETGEPLFTAGQTEALVSQPSSVMLRIATAANTLNGIEFDDVGQDAVGKD